VQPAARAPRVDDPVQERLTLVGVALLAWLGSQTTTGMLRACMLVTAVLTGVGWSVLRRAAP